MIGWTMQEEKDMMTANERIREAAPDPTYGIEYNVEPVKKTEGRP